MIGNREVNYAIIINTEYGKYDFDKISIWNDTDKYYEPYHEPTKSDYAYNTFCELFPILKDVKRDDIIIIRSWDSWHHPYLDTCTGSADTTPRINIYDEREDKIMTKCYNNWIEKQKIKKYLIH